MGPWLASRRATVFRQLRGCQLGGFALLGRRGRWRPRDCRRDQRQRGRSRLPAAAFRYSTGRSAVRCPPHRAGLARGHWWRRPSMPGDATEILPRPCYRGRSSSVPARVTLLRYRLSSSLSIVKIGIRARKLLAAPVIRCSQRSPRNLPSEWDVDVATTAGSGWASPSTTAAKATCVRTHSRRGSSMSTRPASQRMCPVYGRASKTLSPLCRITLLRRRSCSR